MKHLFRFVLFLIAGFVGVIIVVKLMDRFADSTTWVVLAAFVAIIYLIIRLILPGKEKD